MLLIYKRNSKVNQLRLAISLTGAESSCLMACLSMLSVTVRSSSQVKISKQDIQGMTITSSRWFTGWRNLTRFNLLRYYHSGRARIQNCNLSIIWNIDKDFQNDYVIALLRHKLWLITVVKFKPWEIFIFNLMTRVHRLEVWSKVNMGRPG